MDMLNLLQGVVFLQFIQGFGWRLPIVFRPELRIENSRYLTLGAFIKLTRQNLLQLRLVDAVF